MRKIQTKKTKSLIKKTWNGSHPKRSTGGCGCGKKKMTKRIKGQNL